MWKGGCIEEGANKKNVFPPAIVVHIQLGVIFVRNRDGKTPTKRSIHWVIQVLAEVLYELVRPARTHFVRGWVEDGELISFMGGFQNIMCWRGCLSHGTKQGSRTPGGAIPRGRLDGAV